MARLDAAADRVVQPPLMWLTHPLNNDCNDNAKRHYLAMPIDARPAWALFEQPQCPACSGDRPAVGPASRQRPGDRFVVFQYCISIVFMSFKRSSGVYVVRAGEGTVCKAAPWCVLSLLLGWWGIPWGPIWTIGTVGKNLLGGEDVTAQVAGAAQMPIPRAPGAR
ncbi:MAG: hypothetical protein RIQ60_4013 [Pseudomonadota bacterium]|jgi:hypothetical protein